MRVTKAVDLAQLEQELLASGVAVNGLTTFGSDPATDFEIGTYGDGGTVTDLPAGAAAVIAAHTPPPPPAIPDYDGDLMSDEQIRQEAAQAVANLRAYRALASPTAAQRKAFEDLIARIQLYMIRRMLG